MPYTTMRRSVSILLLVGVQFAFAQLTGTSTSSSAQPTQTSNDFPIGGRRRRRTGLKGGGLAGAVVAIVVASVFILYAIFKYFMVKRHNRKIAQHMGPNPRAGDIEKRGAVGGLGGAPHGVNTSTAPEYGAGAPAYRSSYEGAPNFPAPSAPQPTYQPPAGPPPAGMYQAPAGPPPQAHI